MSLTIKDILDNTPEDELYRLFTEYTLRLVENTKDAGIFCVDEDQPVFTYYDRTSVVDQLISDRSNLEDN